MLQSFSPKAVGGKRWLTAAGYLVLIFILALSLPTAHADRQSAVALQSKTAAAQNEAAIAELKQQGGYDSLVAAMRQARYGITNSTIGYGAANPAQNYTSHFAPEGLRLADSSKGAQSWQVRLERQGVGYGAKARRVSQGDLTATGSRISYARTWADQQTNLIASRSSANGTRTAKRDWSRASRCPRHPVNGGQASGYVLRWRSAAT